MNKWSNSCFGKNHNTDLVLSDIDSLRPGSQQGAAVLRLAPQREMIRRILLPLGVMVKASSSVCSEIIEKSSSDMPRPDLLCRPSLLCGFLCAPGICNFPCYYVSITHLLGVSFGSETVGFIKGWETQHPTALDAYGSDISVACLLPSEVLNFAFCP